MNPKCFEYLRAERGETKCVSDAELADTRDKLSYQPEIFLKLGRGSANESVEVKN